MNLTKENLALIGNDVDEALNGEANPKNKKTGFVLIVFPFNSTDLVTDYICNFEPVSNVTMFLESLLSRLKGNA